MTAISPYSVEQRIIEGDAEWVAIRARGAEWSWLTPAEAAELGRQWVERYGRHHAQAAVDYDERMLLPAE